MHNSLQFVQYWRFHPQVYEANPLRVSDPIVNGVAEADNIFLDTIESQVAY
jgi:hypothetical protein